MKSPLTSHCRRRHHLSIKNYKVKSKNKCTFIGWGHRHRQAAGLAGPPEGGLVNSPRPTVAHIPSWVFLWKKSARVFLAVSSRVAVRHATPRRRLVFLPPIEHHHILPAAFHFTATIYKQNQTKITPPGSFAVAPAPPPRPRRAAPNQPTNPAPADREEEQDQQPAPPRPNPAEDDRPDTRRRRQPGARGGGARKGGCFRAWSSRGGGACTTTATLRRRRRRARRSTTTTTRTRTVTRGPPRP